MAYKVIQHSYRDAVVIPENLGYLSTGNYDSNDLERNVSNKVVYANKIKVVRDGVAAGFFHPSQGGDMLTNLVSEIRNAGFNYVPLREIYREFPVPLTKNSNAPLYNKYRLVDSTTNIVGDMVIGNKGTGNSAAVVNSAEVDCKNVFVGMEVGASSNSLDVSMTGAGINCEGVVVAGLNGVDNSIYVTNGGAIVTDEGVLGYFASANSNLVNISGAGSVWSNHYGFYVGPDASCNKLMVSDAGELLGQFGVIGGVAGADMNVAIIDNAIWSNQLHLIVGKKGSGNQLSVTNGGCVFASYAYVGLDYSATNNSIIVSGSNSCLNVQNSLAVGADGPQSRLFIDAGASVTAENVVVGMYDGSLQNSITVAGGKLRITNALDLRRGSISFADGSVVAQSLLVGERGTVHVGERFDLDAIGIITNAGTIILQGSASIPVGILYNVGNGSVQSNSSTVDISGDYINFSLDNDINMTNRMISFTTNAQHTLQTTSQDHGENLAGFSGNHAFGLLGVHGTVDVVNVIYVWSLSGNGVLNLPAGSRFYYVDASDWSGTVNLNGDAVFQKVDVVLSDISANDPASTILAWPAGAGILFSVEWVDNIATGAFDPAISIRALSNSVQWTDTGSVDRLPPQLVLTRFYRLQAKP